MAEQKDLFGDAAEGRQPPGEPRGAAPATAATPGELSQRDAAATPGDDQISASGGGNAGAPPPEIGSGDLPLGRYASSQWLQYAIATVKDRALPRVGDGQKPVQARILYAMWEMSARAGTARKKSARVVGDVLGKYHPHGDASVYDALVRLAQSFTLRYPLIDGEGNFGSRDGDEPAAMRYTEARLTRFADVLLAEIDAGTVDYVANYDGSTEEPAMLPARLPVLLLNGASGIAVGMATEIPSHNLNEVANAAIALIENPDLSIAQLMRYVKGPDFPGGGQIISTRDELREAYTNGRGSVRVRARYSIEKLARGQWQLVINELPPGTSSRRVLEEIDAIADPKPKAGRKSITPEQQRERQLLLSLLERARDESDRQNAVRLVFEPKSSRTEPEEFVNLLLAKTSMETNVSFNLVLIGLDGRPTGKNLKSILSEWVTFRLATVTRRTRHQLDRVLDRIHVLEGRMVVLLNVDEVIRIIRNAEDPKADLIARFAITERQADDILDMRLRMLARLEHFKIEQELTEQRTEQARLEGILGSRDTLAALVTSEIRADMAQHGDARRTRIEAAERAELETPVVNDPVTVIFSQKGWLRARQGHGIELGSLSFKEGDQLAAAIECRTIDPVVFLDSAGRAYTTQAAELPSGRGDGAPVTSLVEVQDGARVLHCVTGAAETALLACSSAGYGFLTRIGDLVSNRRAGRDFMSVPEGEEPAVLLTYDAALAKTGYVVALSSAGKMIAVAIAEMPTLAKGRGVTILRVDKGERVVAAVVVAKAEVIVTGSSVRAGKPRELRFTGANFQHYVSRRGLKGRALSEKLTGLGLRTAQSTA